MVADAHAITTPYDTKKLSEETKSVVLDYLAAGIDPEKSVIFVQSMVPEHFELMHYLSSVITVKRMLHLPTYKEKIKLHPEDVTMALLNYPVLMASDILLYKATDVPVGVDQTPHLEVSRQVARKFNSTYGTDFPEPQIFTTKGKYIPSLLGEGKMSKSVKGSFIELTDDLETIKQRLAKVPTDAGKGESLPEKNSVAALLEFVGMFQGEDVKKEYEKQYLSDGISYKQLKDGLAEAIYKSLEPIQKRRKELEGKVDDVIKEGAEKASMVARETIAEVKEKMGFV